MARPVLRRFEIQVLKDKSGSDPSQVPAAGAVVDFYRQGATVSAMQETIGVGQEKVVGVYDPGALVEGDTVNVARTGAPLAVMEVSATAVKLKNNGAVAVTVLIDDRLMPQALRPVLGESPHGGGGASQVTTDALGRTAGYVTAAPRFDYVVSGGGLAAPRHYIDVLGGTAPSPSWLNVRDFPSLQAAIDALPHSGGEIFLPAGRHRVASTVVIEDRLNVTLRGEGRERTIIERNPAGGDFDVLRVAPSAWAFRLYDLQVDGGHTGPSPGVGGLYSCVFIDGAGFGTHCVFQNVLLRGGRDHGLRFNRVILFTGINLECSLNGSSGVLIEQSTTLRFLHCAFNQNYFTGVESLLDNVSVSLIGCELRDNLGGLEPFQGNALYVPIASQVEAIGCRFSYNLGGPTEPENLVFVTGTPIIRGCWFDGGQRVKRAARFQNCRGGEFSSNTVVATTATATTTDPFSDGVLDVTGPLSKGVVEFCNHDLSGSNRIAGAAVFGLSGGVVRPYRVASGPIPDLGVGDGAFLWVESTQDLLVRTGGQWKKVATVTP